MLDPVELYNRFEYHPPANENIAQAHSRIREDCKTLALKLNTLPAGREQSLAITHLEEVMFWANAAIARSDDNVRD